jgi:hypothetical protein
MSARSEDLPVSAAGIAQGHRAFQEFLLAGERNIVGGLERPGAEARFSQFYGKLPAGVRRNVEGYFRRQSLLDLSQRTALLGPFVRLDISTPLDARTMHSLPAVNSSVRAELEALTHRDRSSTTSGDAAQAEGRAITARDLTTRPQGHRNGPPVRNIDLVLQEVLVEKSNDDDFFHAATDTVHLAITSLSESGQIRTVLNKLGSRNEGQVVKFNDLTLATVPVDQSSAVYPRTFSFKIDAVEKDDGTYNKVLDQAHAYLQEYVTEKLIAQGIVAGGAWLGVPIPAPLANFLASYIKSWFDDALDWLFDLFDNDDDLIGTYTRRLTLTDDELKFLRTEAFDSVASDQGTAAKETPFVHRFNGSGGRWRVKMAFRLR